MLLVRAKRVAWAVQAFAVAMAGGCGIDLTRRDGELSIVLLENDPFRDSEAVFRVEHDGITSETRHAVVDEVVLESVPVGTSRVSATISGRAIVTNRLEVVVLETVRASVGLSLFSATVAEDDDDGDGVTNQDDNCMAVSNAEQSDEDHDGVGDLCDNCPAYPYPSQANLDDDAFGDLCDIDIDGDGMLNVQDACPRDGTGFVDADGDRICDSQDNCLARVNPTQDDCDTDGIGDACDADIDGDTVPNTPGAPTVDNCPFAWNPTQEDANADGIGDACVTDASACLPEGT